ncbi:MAG: hypothetical protein HYZ50_22360 [Deltaproteobacteria bacterium]|nr:hypothetical protein [Deltaproteobacteria bacterium]
MATTPEIPDTSATPLLRERFQELNAVTSRDAAALAAQRKKATLWGLVATPFFLFLRVYFGRGACLRGTAGVVDAMFASYEVFVRHAKLWELHHVKTTLPPSHHP